VAKHARALPGVVFDLDANGLGQGMAWAIPHHMEPSALDLSAYSHISLSILPNDMFGGPSYTFAE
jgi:hypothetical protein